MTAFDFELLVIGAGSGGVRASRMAAAKGVKTAVVENRYLGGTCVNVGCVPKKLFVYASEYSKKFEEAEGFGVHGRLERFEWPELRDNKTHEIKRLNGIYNNLLENSGVTVLHGSASLVDHHTVQVGDATYSAEKILIATGGWPVKPDIPGAEHGITSNEVFYLDEYPQRAVVIGGGYIAVEFAGIFNGLGSDTHLLYRGEQILRGFDGDVRNFAAEQIANKGVHVHTNTDIKRIDKLEDGTLRCQLTSGDIMDTDCVMFATGRSPMTEGLNLEGVGVETRANGTIAVDHFFRSNVPSIYALGDVIGTPQLTPVALAQAMKLVAHWYAGDQEPMSYDNIPTAVFCQPNIATVGLTEEQAVERFGDDLKVFESSFRPMKHTISGMPERSMMKLIVQESTDLVVGAHMVGEDAGEIMQGLAVAIKAGATKAVFDSTIGIHPTAAEEFVTMRSPRS
ncbi:MAG: glutathione-disulfide reductase [Oceanospirillaceae bacterium]|uniref:glutathione-disulfide reductase n=1 Tax=unclassified Thalassolituus TaxID=2624967 RepID=UPI000C526462|nr:MULTISPECIES: glutathione-disulfide reductase [unclassified Thalassolituus]MBL35795.1 glutathione-disulfide reductase [Oceanospirillaceae bacterium]MBS51974.1 glutathione-disulfide reductase [Oceanospirillaceae bacterium]|tara:strand:+ start:778 stop:2136 length:1359 start_codon:yes stop_codon:yes gene_type:complete